MVKFMFSRKATKINKIFTINLTQCSKHQIDGEDFVNFGGLLRKYELYTGKKVRGPFTDFISKNGNLLMYKMSQYKMSAAIW